AKYKQEPETLNYEHHKEFLAPFHAARSHTLPPLSPLPVPAMASSVSFGTVAPAAGRSLGRRLARPSTAHITIPAATKVVAAAAKTEEKGLFDTIFGALYKEEQLLETDPVLNKVGGKAPAAAPAPKKTAGKAEQSGGNGGFSLAGFFNKKD
ncbi:unnamed protein product, partial [Urochloa humidicola]